MMKKIGIGFIGVLALVVALGFYKSAQPPKDLWITTQIFPTCPSRPSCVSSVAHDDVHRIEPLSYTGEASTARAKLERVIAAMAGTRIVHTTPDYLHVLFVTPTMHFRDDVELLVQNHGVIQVRSISRFGYRDHGVNRARIEALRTAFAQ